MSGKVALEINTGASTGECPMRLYEISPPKTHPYIASVNIDPLDFQRLQRMAENEPKLRYLDCDDSKTENWLVRIGCASRAVAAGLKDLWR
jgi:hypothetical protein